MLGLPLENVTVRLGDSTLPQSPLEGGSWTAASVSHAIAVTSRKICEELLRLAKMIPGSPLGDATLDDVALAEGKIVSHRNPGCAVTIDDVLRQGAVNQIERQATTELTDDGKYARNAHSAIFAEVKVDEELGVIRVTRIVNAVAAGRILNTKTAHSQVMGGVVMGIGMALHEETLIDHRFGRIMNADFAEYYVPVNADVRDIEVIFVDEPDEIINPLGVKGVGEIGTVGTAAAIANAIYHATGVRVRELPISLDRLLT
jgi:xanthine dehydrogenase YagR molybdenum-binding subunit